MLLVAADKGDNANCCPQCESCKVKKGSVLNLEK